MGDILSGMSLGILDVVIGPWALTKKANFLTKFFFYESLEPLIDFLSVSG